MTMHHPKIVEAALCELLEAYPAQRGIAFLSADEMLAEAEKEDRLDDCTFLLAFLSLWELAERAMQGKAAQGDATLGALVTELVRLSVLDRVRSDESAFKDASKVFDAIDGVYRAFSGWAAPECPPSA